MLITTQQAIYALDEAVTKLIRNPRAKSNEARYRKALARVAGCTLAEVQTAIAMQTPDEAEGSEP